MMPGSGQKVTRASNRSVRCAGCWPCGEKGTENAVRRSVSTVRGVARPAVRPMAAQDIFHLVFNLELDLFQPDFFELFWLRQIGAIAEVVYLLVEGVMSGG